MKRANMAAVLERLMQFYIRSRLHACLEVVLAA